MGQRSRSRSEPGKKPGARESAGEKWRERERMSTGTRARDQGQRGARSGKGAMRSRQGQAKGQGKGSGEGRIGLRDGTTRVRLPDLPFRRLSRVAEDKGFLVSIIIHLLHPLPKHKRVFYVA